MLPTTSHSFTRPLSDASYAREMQPHDVDVADVADYRLTPAPPLPPSITSLFGSVKHAGRFSVPPQLQLKAAFAELKLDLREALFPDKHVYVVAESLCASVEVLLPEGVTVVDHGSSMFSSHKVSQAGEEHGPVIYLDGWSVCSDVKFISAS
jgi:Cell wall-active antibiotics response 4TMS YvqF